MGIGTPARSFLSASRPTGRKEHVPPHIHVCVPHRDALPHYRPKSSTTN